MAESDGSNGDDLDIINGAGYSNDGRNKVRRRRGPIIATTTTATGAGNKTSVGKLLKSASVSVLWCVLLAAILPQPHMATGAQLYTNTFAVKLHGSSPDGTDHVDEAVAHQVAKRAGSGFENVGKVSKSL